MPAILDFMRYFSSSSDFAFSSTYPSRIQTYVSVVNNVTMTQLRKAKIAIDSAIKRFLMISFHVLLRFPPVAFAGTSMSVRQTPVSVLDSLWELSSVNIAMTIPGQKRKDQP